MSEREPVDPGAAPEASGETGPTPEPTPVDQTPAEPAAPAEPVADAGAGAAAAAGAGAAAGAAGGPPATPPTSTTTTSGPTGGDNRTLLLVGLAVIVVVVIAALLLMNQGNGDGGATPEPSASASAEASPSPEASPSEEPSPEPSLDACAIENLPLVTAGQLTVGTDNPAYPPYFEPREGGNTPPWEGDFVGDPTTGEGFESAIAYAIAEELGFTADQVEWVVVPFANSYAPGPKSFDFDINQISYTPELAEQVDMSDGYYFVNQAVVANADSAIASATTIAELKPYRFGAQVGTTSLRTIQDVIAPDQDPMVYDTNDAAIEALNIGQIDAIVVDLPTAFFMTAVQLDNGKIVGQFEAPSGDDAEYFSLVLEQGSALTPCVNKAIAALSDSGDLEAITKEWLSDKADAPVFGP
jgi:polar amino acid transport system substrate-binding protein